MYAKNLEEIKVFETLIFLLFVKSDTDTWDNVEALSHYTWVVIEVREVGKTELWECYYFINVLIGLYTHMSHTN